MIQPAFEILNQRGTPMFFSDVLANRPTAGIVGRIFIATDSPYGIFRDTGSGWDQIAGSGGGGISGSGAAGQVTFWTGASAVSGSNNLFFDNASGKFLVGTNNTAGAGTLQITSATGDDQLRVWGATSPSIRIDNAVSGATQRFVMGLSTATNNFIQGSAAGDICISTASANPLLFGMWQTSNASEVMRISTGSRLLIGTTTDAGYKVDCIGEGRFNPAIVINRTGGAGSVHYENSGVRYMQLRGNGSNGLRITDSTGNTTYFQFTQNYGGYSDGSTGRFNSTGSVSGAFIGPAYYGETQSSSLSTGSNEIIRIQSQFNGGQMADNFGGYFSMFVRDTDAVNNEIARIAFRRTSTDNGGSLSLITANSGTLNENLRIFNTGNVVIQTGGTFTDAGYKLDVSGTARIFGDGTSNPSLLVGSTTGSDTTFRIQAQSTTYHQFTTGGVNRWYFLVSTFFSNVLTLGNQVGQVVSFGSSTGTQNFCFADTNQGSGFTAVSSALFELRSTTKGFLPPRMTTAQINAISTPAEGLVVYNTTLSHLCCYQAGAWVKFSHTPM